MPGTIGACYNAYKAYRWGDPYIRLVATLADPRRLSIDVGAHLGDYIFFMRRHSAGGAYALPLRSGASIVGLR